MPSDRLADEPTCEVCDVFGIVRRADVLLEDRVWLCWPHHNQELSEPAAPVHIGPTDSDTQQSGRVVFAERQPATFADDWPDSTERST